MKKFHYVELQSSGMNREKSQFALFLEKAYQNWSIGEIKAGNRRPSVSGFAEWLEIPQPTLSNWINDKRTSPDSNYIALLASKLGPGIYDALGMERPDPFWVKFELLFYHLDDEQKQHILKQAEEYALNNINPRRTANSET